MSLAGRWAALGGWFIALAPEGAAHKAAWPAYLLVCGALNSSDGVRANYRGGGVFFIESGSGVTDKQVGALEALTSIYPPLFALLIVSVLPLLFVGPLSTALVLLGGMYCIVLMGVCGKVRYEVIGS